MNKRLKSLDAFRGYTIAAMILVNNPGSWDNVYTPLLHKPWNGLSLADLVFPFFLFIVGIAIAISLDKNLKSDNLQKNLYSKIVIRTLKIFILGLILNLLPDFNFSELRVAGVLQRIAIVYLICSLLYLKFSWKAQSLIGIIILIGYSLCMTLIPVPGEITPTLEPGNNLAAWVDQLLLPGRMWNHTWDPEGIMSTLPAIVTGITGMLAGRLILTQSFFSKKVRLLLLTGLFACFAGILWSLIFPVNKNLWSSSYVLITSGLASMILALSIYIVDEKGFSSIAQPGIIFGANAIAIYVFSNLLAHLLYGLPINGYALNTHFMEILTSAGISLKNTSLLFAITCVLLSFLPGWFLYKKHLYIKL